MWHVWFVRLRHCRLRDEIEFLSGGFLDLSQTIVVSNVDSARAGGDSENASFINIALPFAFYRQLYIPHTLTVLCLQPNMRLDGTVEFFTDTVLRHTEKHRLQAKADRVS